MNTPKWLHCRLCDLQARLVAKGHPISLPVISRLLKKRDYRLRAHVKTQEGVSPRDRDQQFAYLLTQRQQFSEAGQPILSIDPKKKELVGDFKNPGGIWCQQAERGNVPDFARQGAGKAVPYGLYDLTHNLGTV